MAKNISKKTLLDFLRKNPVMSIAVCDGNHPLSSVVLCSIDDNFVMYFITGERSFKAKALMKNPQISISDWVYNSLFVQAKGVAEQITDTDEAEKYFGNVMSVLNEIKDIWPPVLSIDNGKYTVFRVKLTWIRVLNLQDLKITEAKPPYREYEFKR